MVVLGVVIVVMLDVTLVVLVCVLCGSERGHYVSAVGGHNTAVAVTSEFMSAGLLTTANKHPATQHPTCDC